MDGCKTNSPSLSFKLLTSLVAFAVGLLAVELLGQLMDFDFSRQKAAFEAQPIFYRQPIDPIGTVFFKRTGPDRWYGPVLRTGLQQTGAVDKAYEEEEPLLITYDRDGFRNPENLDEWEIVFTGDSFTELGYLRYEDLFTTRVGRILEKPVKNVGVSHTGPFSYIHCVKEFGISKGTTDAVLVFFEGNDLKDLMREREQIREFKITGQREYRDLDQLKKQTSFLKAIGFPLRDWIGEKWPGGRWRKPELRFHNAYFLGAEGKVPLSLFYAPPNVADLEPDEIIALEEAIKEWSETTRQLSIRPWLVFAPCKRRVLDDALEFTDRTVPPMVHWTSSDLIDHLQKLCDAHGINMIDPTPALCKETTKGNLTFNPMFDTHFNQRGSHIMSEVIAEQMRSR